MNGPDPLSIARQQLFDALSNFQAPPSDPLNVSAWVAMSLLQKAIRRGEERLALQAAATLLRDAPDRLWRRSGCIAFEDIGVADFNTVAIALLQAVDDGGADVSDSEEPFRHAPDLP
jgi:replication-associated recombination protein RarA